jgi:adenylosuccinate lyase
VERVIGPDATGIADFMVRRAASLIDGLVVNAQRMRQNLEYTGGLFFSEGVMLALVRKGLPRQTAYEIVQRNALAVAAALGGPAPPSPTFRERLSQDPDVSGRLSPEEIEQAFDLHHHVRWSGAIIDRALRDQEP